jgi:hypothetical protein
MDGPMRETFFATEASPHSSSKITLKIPFILRDFQGGMARHVA